MQCQSSERLPWCYKAGEPRSVCDVTAALLVMATLRQKLCVFVFKHNLQSSFRDFSLINVTF